ncbi:MAG: DUF2779 domain-containing protein [Bacteroidetes bacterium]|nr:DUF2779 domain-containing protein [Bacteroidota bacterium]
MPSTYLISKSTFLKGNQCTKAIYLNRFHKELRDEMDESQEAVFAQGTNVGQLAQGLFPNGVDCSPEDQTKFDKSAIRTTEEISNGQKVIYEATFIYDEVLCALDILVKDKAGWIGYEVKSSTEVKDTYILDSALQYYVITNSGIKLKDFFIVHINNEYVKSGKLNIKKLFSQKSIIKEIKELQPFIAEKIRELKTVIKAKQIPKKDIGLHCSDPYPCDFSGHCWKHIPEYSVFDIANLRGNKKFELYYQGILDIKEIPKDAKLNEKQWQQIECELEQKVVIDKPKIKAFIKSLNYPLHFLDFETFQLAVPIFDNSRPYQQLVFQYSLHTLDKKGTTKHFEFLADGTKDPRIDFIEQLIKDCGEGGGDILVYNISFERGKLNQLAEDFPKYEKQISKIVERLKDLMVPFQKRWYYKPELRGSYSIKQVLPCLVPELSYDSLNIANGGTASATFSAIVEGTFEGDIEETRKHLLEYCKLDTLAMVKIVEVLEKV